jgi:hypothetical protein
MAEADHILHLREAKQFLSFAMECLGRGEPSEALGWTYAAKAIIETVTAELHSERPPLGPPEHIIKGTL